MPTNEIFDVAGLRVAITGGTSGIGLAIARAFLRSGAHVHLGGLGAADCEEALACLAGDGRGATASGIDLSSRSGCDAFCDAALETLGGIDALVCSAGIEGPVGPLGQCGTDELRTLLAVNLEAPIWLSGRVAPLMARAGGGTIILLSSIAGLRGNRAIGAYAMTKAAVAQLARNLAVEWGPDNIRANAISPGLIRTPMAQALMSDATFMARRLSGTPLRRVGEPDEIAGAALFLASPAGAFVTGHNLVIDGGTTIRDDSAATHASAAPTLREVRD